MSILLIGRTLYKPHQKYYRNYIGKGECTMKAMKKSFLVLLLVLMICMLTACGNDKDKNDQSSTSASQTCLLYTSRCV